MVSPRTDHRQVFGWVVSNLILSGLFGGFPGSASGKEPACQCILDVRDAGSIPGLERSPWRRAWQPTPIFLPGESHGQRSVVG